MLKFPNKAVFVPVSAHVRVTDRNHYVVTGPRFDKLFTARTEVALSCLVGLEKSDVRFFAGYGVDLRQLRPSVHDLALAL